MGTILTGRWRYVQAETDQDEEKNPHSNGVAQAEASFSPCSKKHQNKKRELMRTPLPCYDPLHAKYEFER